MGISGVAFSILINQEKLNAHCILFFLAALHCVCVCSFCELLVIKCGVLCVLAKALPLSYSLGIELEVYLLFLKGRRGL